MKSTLPAVTANPGRRQTSRPQAVVILGPFQASRDWELFQIFLLMFLMKAFPKWDTKVCSCLVYIEQFHLVSPWQRVCATFSVSWRKPEGLQGRWHPGRSGPPAAGAVTRHVLPDDKGCWGGGASPAPAPWGGTFIPEGLWGGPHPLQEHCCC